MTGLAFAAILALSSLVFSAGKALATYGEKRSRREQIKALCDGVATFLAIASLVSVFWKAQGDMQTQSTISQLKNRVDRLEYIARVMPLKPGAHDHDQEAVGD